MAALRRVEGSVLEEDSGSVTSLEIPKINTNERVRRRSELARIRPHPSTAAGEAEAIELPVIAEYGGDGGRVAFHKDVKDRDVDVEIAPSFPNSLAPSFVAPSEEEDTAPALSPAQNASLERKRRINFFALCLALIMNGWNDGTAGPLLTRIQSYYNIGYVVVSLIFISNTVGYLSGAVANVYLTDKFGFGKMIAFGSACQFVAYAMVVPGGPFPIMCIAYVISGFGISIQNAHANGFVASSLHHVSTKLSLLHASYGLGALTAPLVSTVFAQQKHWSFHFFISAGFSVVNTLLLVLIFRGKRQEVILAESGDLRQDPDAVLTNKYKQIFNMREVHFLATFALIYVGTEVTIGSWSVSYVQEKRHGNANSGYISSGFFAGLMLGRILLMWLNRKIGERRALFIYALIAIQLEVTVWVVPSLIENALAVAVIGLLLGPMYPIMLNHGTKILPRWLLTGCMGYIAGVGQAGSAVLPFITGVLASKFGIASLQPFVVSMMSTLIVVWALIPRVRHVPT